MSTKQIEKFQKIVFIPEDVKVSYRKNMLHIEGPLGKVFKNFKKIPVNIEINENKISIKAQGLRKRDYAILNTARSIIQNLCEGVKDGYTVKMKVVYAHFPITVKIKERFVYVENFQGERSPRIAKIEGNTKVVSKGEDVILTGPVLTEVTETAANIQLNTKVKNKDHRVFLDGIYVYEKTKGIHQ